VTINDVVCTIKSDTATQIVIKIPSTATTGKFKVKTTGGKAKTPTAFTVT
jgi:hypothetical protein